MGRDEQERKSVIVPAEPPVPDAEPKSGPDRKRQPRYWVRLAVFFVPLVLSEIMFWKVGRVWNAVIFPVVWTAFFYVQMKRGGWNIFKP